jgi:hypothetical protein
MGGDDGSNDSETCRIQFCNLWRFHRAYCYMNAWVSN